MKLLTLAALLAATTASAQTFAPVNTAVSFSGNMYVSAPGLRILNCPVSGLGFVNGKGKLKLTSVTPSCVGVNATNLPWSWFATGKGHVSFFVNGTNCSTSDQLYVAGGAFEFTDSGRTPCTINGVVLATPKISIIP